MSVKQAQLIIIGGGIVGSAAAYHLARMGWQDILVLEKGDLFEVDGSTSHAPGGVAPLSHSKVMTQFGSYSVKLYKSLAAWRPERNGVNLVGGIELARTDDRMVDLMRLHSAAKSYGVETAPVTPAQIKERLPIINPAPLKGGLWIKDKLIASGVDLCGALARDTEATGGAKFIGNTKVTDILIQDGRVAGVKTDNPEMPAISCPQILLAANIWSPLLSEKAGVTLPLLSAEHQYVITTPVPALSSLDPSKRDDEIIYPSVRDLDVAMYSRHHWQSIGIGNYNHKPLMVRPRDLGKTAMNPFTPEDFSHGWSIAQELFPDLQGAELVTKFNGMFSFSIDGMPIIGEAPAKGFWIATASWLTHAGGVAKTVAELMTHGEAEVDTRQVSVNRFLSHQTTQRYIDIACAKNYAEVYDLTHPAQPMSKPRGVLHTPFYSRHQALGAEFLDSGGWEMPYWYEENSRLLEQYDAQLPERSGWGAKYWSRIQGAEHLAARNNVALFDLTSLAIVEVAGSGAAHYLNHICTNQMDISVGEVVYTLLCTPSGGIRRDMTAARLADDRYWLFTGMGTLGIDVAWLRRHLPANNSVQLRDLSQTHAAIGLWGANARRVLEKASPNDVSNEAFPFYTHQMIEVGYTRLFAMRISYAGELGWELHMPFGSAPQVWDVLWKAGQELDIVAAGIGAFRSLRVEKGYRLWGSDIHTEYNPYDAGMGWMVKLNKGDFIGREALRALKEQGSAQRLAAIAIDDPNCAVMGFEPIFANGDCIGHVSSGNYGYSVGKMIAFGYLPRQHAGIGTPLEVEYLGNRYPAQIAADVLYDPKDKRLKG